MAEYETKVSETPLSKRLSGDKAWLGKLVENLLNQVPEARPVDAAGAAVS